MRSDRVFQSCRKYMAVRVVSYQAFPGHIVYKSDKSQNNKCTIFISKPPHRPGLVILSSAATFSLFLFYLDEEQMKLLFHCLRGPRKLIGWRVQETPICALQRMALAKSLFFSPQGCLAQDNVIQVM